MSRYILVPVGAGETSEIEIPQGLFVDVHQDLYDRVPDTKLLRKLLLDLTKRDILETAEGGTTFKGKQLNLNFKDFIVNILNYRFLEEYESFLTLLRKQGITF